MKDLNEHIRSIIEKFERKSFLIHQFEESCTCVNYETKEPDPKCMKCLGTGFRIRIKIINTASQEMDDSGTISSNQEYSVDKVFYMNPKYTIKEDDWLIEYGEVYIVFKKIDITGFKGEVAYIKCLTAIKKQDKNVFFENFKKIVGDNPCYQ